MWNHKFLGCKTSQIFQINRAGNTCPTQANTSSQISPIDSLWKMPAGTCLAKSAYWAGHRPVRPLYTLAGAFHWGKEMDVGLPLCCLFNFPIVNFEPIFLISNYQEFIWNFCKCFISFLILKFLSGRVRFFSPLNFSKINGLPDSNSIFFINPKQTKNNFKNESSLLNNS